MAFFGKRLFDLPKGDKPHIVFLYLESFRAKEVGKCTPSFDKLKEEGIYFPNFYANATQTFKGYVLQRFLGSLLVLVQISQKALSSVLSLPLRGLPNFFHEHGYKNIFMKAGSMHFERQGDFLRNHHFDELYDEKDVKANIKGAYGTSWGVHDEFLYTFLRKAIEQAREPLFLSAASVTNHHPFLLPTSFTPKYGKTPFGKKHLNIQTTR